MNEKEVKKSVGKANWLAFEKFMYGKTIGINDKDEIDYFEADVSQFKSILRAMGRY